MKIANLLHFYQPYNQQDDILNRVVNESYLPITEGLLKIKNQKFKLTVNVSGALSQLLHEKGHQNVIDNLKSLAEQNKIEFTSSAMYHPFLPLLSAEEIKRQVALNNDINRHVFGNFYNPSGFFPPELAINNYLLKIILQLGYKWVVAPELSYAGSLSRDGMYKYGATDLYLMLRHKRVSSLILSSTVKSAKELLNEAKDLQKQKYWFTVMDAETFGHHRIGHEKFLFDLLTNPKIDSVSVSDLLAEKLKTTSINIRPCSWTNEEQDFWVDKAHSFTLWQDPTNPIHRLQWKLTELVISQVHTYKFKDSLEWKSAREKLDKAISSDQYWWASAKPWWSLEMIEQGAFSLKDVVLLLKIAEKIKIQADELYRAILDQAFEWQRTGYIRKRHLQNSATYMQKPFKKRTPKEWYNQIILEFENEMIKSATNLNFEKAIKWRDAILKLKQGTDIYDVLHVVDELWSARNIPAVKPFLKHNWMEFSKFAKKSFLGVSKKQDFERWKKEKK